MLSCTNNISEFLCLMCVNSNKMNHLTHKLRKVLVITVTVLLLGIGTDGKWTGNRRCEKRLRLVYKANCIPPEEKCDFENEESRRTVSLDDRDSISLDDQRILKYVKLYEVNNLRQNWFHQNCSIQKFQEIRETLERGLDFFNNTLHSLETFEALYTTRAIQAQVKLSLENINGRKAAPEVYQALTQLKECAGELSKEIILEIDDLGQLQSISKTQSREKMMTGMLFWKMPSRNSWKNGKLLPLKNFQSASNLEKKTGNENSVEQCQDQLAIDCEFNQDCADIVLRRPETLISMVNNVEFLNLGEKFNCIHDPEYSYRSSISSASNLFTISCGNLPVD